jgi:glutamyl-tRNA synthetase
MQLLSDHEYINFVKKFINFDVSIFKDRLDDVLLLFKKQLSYASQINELVQSTFLNNNHKKDINPLLINSLKTNLNKFNEISFDDATSILKNIQSETNLKGKDLYMPIRLLLTGNEHGPELNKIMSILGKQEILEIIS